MDMCRLGVRSSEFEACLSARRNIALRRSDGSLALTGVTARNPWLAGDERCPPASERDDIAFPSPNLSFTSPRHTRKGADL
jgi:hypothetical protein